MLMAQEENATGVEMGAIAEQSQEPTQADGDDKISKSRSRSCSSAKDYWSLIRFIAPLIITLMAPDIAEQALNRGLTSIATDEMITLLASFGLAYYFVKLLTGGAMETRQAGMVLIHTRQDYLTLLLMSALVGVFFTVVLLVTGLTVFGDWLIGDVHRQSEEVTTTTMAVISWLSPAPIIEAIVKFHEGHLIAHKLTVHAGVANLIDFSMQVVFTVVLLFTPTRTDPILIPVFALYAGYVARIILVIGFWITIVRPGLKDRKEVSDTKPVTLGRGLLFWVPLAIVRIVQVISRPIINLVVSRQLAATDVDSATKALAVLTACYPMIRFVFSWLNDLRAIIPTFYKDTPTRKRYDMQVLTIFACGCTAFVFLLSSLMFFVPTAAFKIMHVIIGLTEELANMSVVPLRILTGLCITVGSRAFLTGYFLLKKKTSYLIPSAVIRLVVVIVSLISLPLTTGLSGAPLGATSLLLGFLVEVFTVAAAVVAVKYMSKREKQRSCQDNEKKTSEPCDTELLSPASNNTDVLSTSLTSLSG